MTDREWTLSDGKKIRGRANRVTFGSALRNAEIEIVEGDGTLWPLFVEDFSIADIKWIKSRIGETIGAPGESIPFPDDDASI